MILSALAATLLVLSPQSQPAAPPPLKAGWSPKDRDAIVDLLRKLREAKEKDKGEKEAKEKLAKAFEDLGKRLKADPLSFVGDLQKVLEAVPAYDSRASDPAIGKEAWAKSVFEPRSKFRYAIRLPKGYDAKRPWPLLLVIPPAGEEADKHLKSAWKEEGLQGGTILAAAEMPAKVAEWRTWDGGVAAAFNTLRELFALYNVDRDRIVVAGVKEGGAFALTLASYFPDRFAGAVSRGGGATGAAFANLGNVPSYFTGTGEEGKAIAEAVKPFGLENVTTVETDDLAAAAKWIGERVRNPLPPKLVFSPVQHFARNAYWIKVENFLPVPDYFGTAAKDRPQITGKIERDANKAEFEVRGITDFTLLLTDALLDLDKPIKVVVNGKTWEGSYKRELEKFLLLTSQRNDPRAVYVAFHAQAVPKP
ncbi:MAG TPA: hypothetical protein VFI25_13075 [Planctomycetota bacterium]|jgi:pimeloyl-ACP methyl ester carboxylesterase|nr:hypothetical protein [Planctomycetota bacterium]